MVGVVPSDDMRPPQWVPFRPPAIRPIRGEDHHIAFPRLPAWILRWRRTHIAMSPANASGPPELDRTNSVARTVKDDRWSWPCDSADDPTLHDGFSPITHDQSAVARRKHFAVLSSRPSRRPSARADPASTISRSPRLRRHRRVGLPEELIQSPLRGGSSLPRFFEWLVCRCHMMSAPRPLRASRTDRRSDSSPLDRGFEHLDRVRSSLFASMVLSASRKPAASLVANDVRLHPMQANWDRSCPPQRRRRGRDDVGPRLHPP